MDMFGTIKLNREIILYGIFGILTTAVNAGVYFVLYAVLEMSNILCTAIAWIVAVMFAFITNKLWVFKSGSFHRNIFLHELISFFSCRVFSGVIDLGIMYVSVDVLGQNELLWKMLSNVVVIIINYIASKLLIFK